MKSALLEGVLFSFTVVRLQSPSSEILNYEPRFFFRESLQTQSVFEPDTSVRDHLCIEARLLDQSLDHKRTSLSKRKLSA
jgi:hypothetical protein